MSQSIQALRERRGARAQTLHQLLENNPGETWNEDHQATYDEGMSDIGNLDNEITRITDLNEKLAADRFSENMNEAGDRYAHDNKDKPAAALYAKWLRGGDGALSAEEWAGIRATMSTTAVSEGGYTVQTDVVQTVMDALKAFGGMRSVANVIQTEMGNQLDYPTSDGTAEEGEQVAENVAATDQDVSFGLVSLNTYKYSSKVVPVPIELLQDSAVDIEAFVNHRLVQRIGRITNSKFTTGTGVNEPRGIVTAATAGKVGATEQTDTITYADLIDLFHSVDPAYRENGTCSFMMNDASLQVLHHLRDSVGRPIYLPAYDGLAGPLPDSLLGHNITINQNVAPMAVSAKSILFGDFNYYVIRDVMAANLLRFDDSAYAKRGQVGFLMFSRHGGNFTDVGGAVKYYQNAAS
ncbi:MAG: phage major capsid protein [Chromatiales bacterium]